MSNVFFEIVLDKALNTFRLVPILLSNINIFYERKAHLRQMSRSLLQAGKTRAGTAGDALRRPAYAAAPPDADVPAYCGWVEEVITGRREL